MRTMNVARIAHKLLRFAIVRVAFTGGNIVRFPFIITNLQ